MECEHMTKDFRLQDDKRWHFCPICGTPRPKAEKLWELLPNHFYLESLDLKSIGLYDYGRKQLANTALDWFEDQVKELKDKHNYTNVYTPEKGSIPDKQSVHNGNTQKMAEELLERIRSAR